MTIGGTIYGNLIFRVPAGIYHAWGSIIVNNEDAELTFEASVRIMFAPSAAILIRQGTLQVLGTSASPVVLALTSLFSAEFGDAEVIDSEEWAGIYFGPGANSATLLDTEYVGGSLLRHCKIVNAGYGGVLSAAVEMENSAILMESVVVEGSGSDGIFLTGDSGSDMVMSDVWITGLQRHGLFSSSFNALVFLRSLNVTSSGNRGAYLNRHGMSG